jgi:hypothetical protein
MTSGKKVKRRGRVGVEQVRQKTASEHEAVVLETDAGERLILQRIGANPFEDASTRDLVGRQVEIEGFLEGRTLRYVEARDAERPPEPGKRRRRKQD